jgi:hypothetical protein
MTNVVPIADHATPAARVRRINRRLAALGRPARLRVTPLGCEIVSLIWPDAWLVCDPAYIESLIRGDKPATLTNIKEAPCST